MSKVQWMLDHENKLAEDNNYRAYWALDLLGVIARSKKEKTQKAWDRIING